MMETILALYVFVVVPNSAFLSDIFASALVDLANADRSAAKVGELKVNPLLAHAAELKAADMAAKGYFSHTGPDGTTPWDWMDKAGYRFSYGGENLAINFVDSVDVENAWMHSAEHRANITSSDFTEVGVGIARGVYQGQDATFVVELFGTSAPAVAVATPPKARTKLASVAPPSQKISLSPAPLARYNSVSVSPAVLVTEPRHVASSLYLGIAVLVAVVFALFVRYGKHPWHRSLVVNAALLSGVALFLVGANMLIFPQHVDIAIFGQSSGQSQQ